MTPSKELKMQSMTVGQAVKDPRTALGRAAVQTASDRAARLAAAQAIVDRDGITLEEAVQRVWAQVSFEVRS